MGAIIWARVRDDGVELASHSVQEVTKIGDGRYNIFTSVEMPPAAIVVGTINTNDSTDPGPGSASILVGQVNATTLFVRTATPSSSFPANVDNSRPFSVVAYDVS